MPLSHWRTYDSNQQESTSRTRSMDSRQLKVSDDIRGEFATTPAPILLGLLMAS